MLPVLRLRVVGTQFDNHHISLERHGIAPCLFVPDRLVALLQERAGTASVVLHHIVAAQQLLQLSGPSLCIAHIDAVAIGDTVADTSHAHSITTRRLVAVEPGGEVA